MNNIKNLFLKSVKVNIQNSKGIDLKKIDIRGSFIRDVIHRNSDSNFTNISSDLIDVNLQGANLKNANLLLTNLEGANLLFANLEGSNLKSANLKYANLRRSNMERAILIDTNLFIRLITM